MKKIFILMMALMMSFVSVNAQTAIETPKFFDNTYISVGGGASTPLDFYDVLPLNPSATLNIGKWFTPVWGAELEGTAWFGSHDARGTANRWDFVNTHNIVRGSYVGVNGLVNFMNLFAGYKGTPRLFEVNGVVGLGWAHYYRPNVSDKYSNALGARTGLDLAFNLGKKKAHSISVRPAVLWNLSRPGNSVGQLAFNKMGAQLYLGVAYTYHFKTSNKTHNFKVYDVGAMQGEIDRLNAELGKKPHEVVREVVKEVKVVEKVNTSDAVVYFAFDSAELDDRAKEELDKLGENGIYVVDAWASSEGTTEYNLALSQRRADAVKAYLEARGCKIESAVGHGVQFGTTTGRVAVVTVK